MNIYADGGSLGNGTEHADGYGSFRIQDEEPVRLTFGKTTNNVAEYSSLIAALNYCIENHIVAPDIFMDSELVVYQLNGTWQVRKPHLRPYCTEAKRLLRLTGGKLTWVSRDVIVKELGH